MNIRNSINTSTTSSIHTSGVRGSAGRVLGSRRLALVLLAGSLVVGTAACQIGGTEAAAARSNGSVPAGTVAADALPVAVSTPDTVRPSDETESPRSGVDFNPAVVDPAVVDEPVVPVAPTPPAPIIVVQPQPQPQPQPTLPPTTLPPTTLPPTTLPPTTLPPVQPVVQYNVLVSPTTVKLGAGCFPVGVSSLHVVGQEYITTHSFTNVDTYLNSSSFTQISAGGDMTSSVLGQGFAGFVTWTVDGLVESETDFFLSRVGTTTVRDHRSIARADGSTCGAEVDYSITITQL